MSQNRITDVIALVGLTKLASALKVSYQAIRKWEKAGRLPRTEWTGETNYAEVMERLTEGRVSKGELLDLNTAARSSGEPPQEAAA